MNASKPLNLTDEQRASASVTFNVNRFEIYTASGMFLTAATSNADLSEHLAVNRFDGIKLDGAAQAAWRRGRSA